MISRFAAPDEGRRVAYDFNRQAMRRWAVLIDADDAEQVGRGSTIARPVNSQ
ncbi:MAG: hypothetical protein JNK76_23290 [Planctomycetales bacterium]|nr:hypothetical protein [Planctomycetales bacterium]